MKHALAVLLLVVAVTSVHAADKDAALPNPNAVLWADKAQKTTNTISTSKNESFEATAGHDSQGAWCHVSTPRYGACSINCPTSAAAICAPHYSISNGEEIAQPQCVCRAATK